MPNEKDEKILTWEEVESHLNDVLACEDYTNGLYEGKNIELKNRQSILKKLLKEVPEIRKVDCGEWGDITDFFKKVNETISKRGSS